MRVAIGLGASQGDRRQTLERTIAQLARTPGLRFVRASRWYRSAPMRGGAATGWFLNGVAVFDASIPPDAVLARCRALESAAGRRRARWWGDRPLDLDVLVAEGVVSDDPALVLPHPGLAARAFVWWPLREAWPELAPWLDTIAPVPPPLHGIVTYAAMARPEAAMYLPRPPRARGGGRS
ncbi:MAG TPA: 2-amino-4-hydroxy-6-hydroxymethyldihydropteridine diphosphokinase [Myxococcota bacterium]|nr:2-amino-4-hydroxy-6-hydroxymethyldihydropteridine diphosphokinase [Myxococcota bacterium]